ncbi:MAG: tyrosine-protein phosphatase [Pontiellaceae bacterium]|nr:tyrosine-protein phosphatase [Pontiellaceae bacterium]
MKWVLGAVCMLLMGGCASQNAVPTARPAEWAQPIELADVPNLHRITDQLYRSAQPTDEGMENLKAMGIETIINLRSFNSDRKEIGDTGLGYEHIYMKAWHPERKEAIRFLQIVMNEKRQPVLFHCRYGADRTGTMCAVYRIVVQGWSKEAAIAELEDGGYEFHSIWSNLTNWIEKLDVESIREELGLIDSAEETL